MTEPVIIAMITALGASIITGFVTLRVAKNDRPIKKAEADTATVVGLAGVEGVYGELFENLRTEVREVRADAKELRTELASQGNQIKELRTELRSKDTIIDRATAWIEDVHHRWNYHRAQDQPPAMPHLNYDYE